MVICPRCLGTHGSLAPRYGRYGAHITAARKQEVGEMKSKDSFKGPSSIPHFIYLHDLLTIYQLPTVLQAGDQAFNIRSFGDIPETNCDTVL